MTFMHKQEELARKRLGGLRMLYNCNGIKINPKHRLIQLTANFSDHLLSPQSFCWTEGVPPNRFCSLFCPMIHRLRFCDQCFAPLSSSLHQSPHDLLLYPTGQHKVQISQQLHPSSCGEVKIKIVIQLSQKSNKTSLHISWNAKELLELLEYKYFHHCIVNITFPGTYLRA